MSLYRICHCLCKFYRLYLCTLRLKITENWLARFTVVLHWLATRWKCIQICCLHFVTNFTTVYLPWRKNNTPIAKIRHTDILSGHLKIGNGHLKFNFIITRQPKEITGSCGNYDKLNASCIMPIVLIEWSLFQ